jgi:hypothetical protein
MEQFDSETFSVLRSSSLTFFVFFFPKAKNVFQVQEKRCPEEIRLSEGVFFFSKSNYLLVRL